MKILNVVAERDGCWLVRNKVPFSYLRQKGHIIDEFVVDEKFDYDIVIFNRTLLTQGFDGLLSEIAGRGIKIVYDTDDLMLLLNETNPFSTDEQTRRAVSQVPTLLSHADLVTTSTLPLKEEIEKVFKGPVVQLPNCLNLSDWRERKKEKRFLRIGWAGSIAHGQDLNLILPTIEQLQLEYGFEFILFGITYGNLKGEFKKLKKDVLEAKVRIPKWVRDFLEVEKTLGQIKYRHIPLVPINKYPETLASLNLDIGLCPLADSRFNRCKSAIKFYEYAACGTLTLASRVTPYKEEGALTVKNRYDKWTKKLAELIEDKDLRGKLLSEQRGYIRQKGDIEKNGHLWESAYSCLLEA